MKVKESIEYVITRIKSHCIGLSILEEMKKQDLNFFDLGKKMDRSSFKLEEEIVSYHDYSLKEITRFEKALGITLIRVPKPSSRVVPAPKTTKNIITTTVEKESSSKVLPNKTVERYLIALKTIEHRISNVSKVNLSYVLRDLKVNSLTLVVLRELGIVTKTSGKGGRYIWMAGEPSENMAITVFLKIRARRAHQIEVRNSKKKD